MGRGEIRQIWAGRYCITCSEKVIYADPKKAQQRAHCSDCHKEVLFAEHLPTPQEIAAETALIREADNPRAANARIADDHYKRKPFTLRVTKGPRLC